jgi:tagaturonate reductase
MVLPTLTRELLSKHTATVPLQWPDPAVFGLPERVLQFGTGVLLRGLCDAFFDEANRHGRFRGRVVVVKSTDQGDGDAFARQDGLFTHVIRGLENGRPVEEYRVNASLSRTLSARSQWTDVLACAHNPDLQLVVSNTTEVGIQLDETEDLNAVPPASFPGKLTRFLHERWQAFGGNADAGLVIVPTELIPDNGTKLQEICLELAHRGGLEVAFLDWLESANQFCNSLVDRIVPGKPNATELADYERKLGYRDGLLCVSEVYRLWAIEAPVDTGDERVKAAFDALDVCPAGLIIAPDIEMYRELKLRLLNGTHTLTCGLGFLSGKNAVRESMDDPAMGNFVERLMLDELAPAIPYDLPTEAAETFGRQVLDRFRNPFIEHKLLSISVQYTAKMRMRNVPLLVSHYERQGYAPDRFCLGFAAYLLFMKAVGEDGGQYFGRRDGQPYPIQDEAAGWFCDWWERGADVAEVLAHEPFWGQDLNALPGFAERVGECLAALQERGAAAVLAESEGVLVKN